MVPGQTKGGRYGALDDMDQQGVQGVAGGEVGGAHGGGEEEAYRVQPVSEW